MRAAVVLGLTLASVLVAGCSSTDSESTTAGTDIAVSIANGTVTPTNEQIDAVVGQPITVTVDSDAADELHVHSTPDQSFDIEPGPNQVFEFTVEIPGRVALELHDLDRTIATLDVRP
jgi:hypothetical protein